MDLSGWYAIVIIVSMAFLFLGGVVCGFLGAVTYMVINGARHYEKSKKQLDEAMANLAETEQRQKEAEDGAFVVHPGIRG